MVSVPSPFGGPDDDVFEPRDEFVPGSIPTPGAFLEGHDFLRGDRHLAFHRLSRELFEERAVYDMTFGYNLARLNEDTRHREAGYRYAVEDPAAGDAGDEAVEAGADLAVPVGDERRVLRAEFTPTTPFCPQSDTLTKGSFRAWNGLADRHEYDLVRVRVAPMHQRAAPINDRLREMETELVETGGLPDAGEAASHRERARGGGTDGSRTGDRAGSGLGERDGSRSPF